MPPRAPWPIVVVSVGTLLVSSACVDPSPPPAVRPSATTSRASMVPLALLVHSTRALVAVKSTTARRLLSGSVTRWRDLGGREGPLHVVAGPSAFGLVSSKVRRAASDVEAIREVERDPDVVGAVAATSARPSVRAVLIDGIDPIRDPHRYPISVPGTPQGPVVTAIVTGDIMLGRRVGALLERTGDFTEPFRWTAARLAAADITFANLESTLSRDGAPRQGNDSFGASPDAIEGLRHAGIDAVSLANNHTGDFGDRALERTREILERAGIEPAGAGATETVARRPAVIERKGLRFGFLAFNSIGETPRAGQRRPGAFTVRIPPRFPLFVRADLMELERAVRTLRRTVDVVIVMPHWGAQYTGRQDRYQRRVARALAAAGADLVVGSHPHWLQGMEMIGGTFVAYSLGNFIFDMDWSRATREGAAIELIFWGRQLMAVHPLPVRIDDRFRPRPLTGDDARLVLRRMWRASPVPFAEPAQAGR